MARHATVSQLAAAMCRGDRVALSRALTLVESKNRQNQKDASQLLSAVLPQRPPQSLRIGISGPPGTGKSTLIEALGGELVSRGHRLAVLAVDPSSQRSGGSIMGDKTRMPTLAVNQRAFIRPSPAQGVLGGVARRTSDAILCCECAGYDRVIVETVGVGQSETAVAGLVDMFVLLVPPAAGDGLQGVKRGIMELADLVVVTKADGALKEVANTMAQDMRSALRVLRPRTKACRAPLTPTPTLALALTMTLAMTLTAGPDQAWAPRVIKTSVVSHSPRYATATAPLADLLEEFRHAMGSSGELLSRRREQAQRSALQLSSESSAPN